MTTADRASRARPAWLDDAGAALDQRDRPAWVTAACAVGGVVYVGATGYAIQTGDSGVLAAVAVIPVLVGVTVVIARWLAKLDNDPSVASLVMGALAVKLLGSAIRYWTAYAVYDGATDATVYDKAGQAIGAQWRTFNFTFDVGGGHLAGTNFVKLLTGIVYAVSPATRTSGFFVCAWIAFLGFILYWRAFKLAFPTIDSRKYALLVLLLPSLVYWPSSIGKESWMALGLGLSAYGAARLSSGRTLSGLACVLLSMVLVLGVRPHMAICVFAGLTAMMLLLCTQWRQMQRPLLPLLAVFVLVLAGNVAVQHTKDYLGVSSLTQETVNQTLDKTNKQSSQGGSEFKAVRVSNPVKFPYAFATVFWRPFPYEVKKAQQMIAAAEGMVLLGLTLLSWRSIAAIPRRLRASPYLGYAILFVIVFVYAFSAFSNFGLLARERTQVLPLYLVLLALPALPRKADATPPPPNGQFAARWARNA